MAKRLGLEEGYKLKTTVFEFSYKDDELGDPLINSYHAVAIGAATFEEIDVILKMTATVNDVLKEVFAAQNINLIDFKIEFGRCADGTIVLADEISPDTCRFWDATTGEKLDKDRFRRDLGNVKDAYVEILKRISK
jgi:phosphoribosylaminoimidazole-succinocarboxamide synthase